MTLLNCPHFHHGDVAPDRIVRRLECAIVGNLRKLFSLADKLALCAAGVPAHPHETIVRSMIVVDGVRQQHLVRHFLPDSFGTESSAAAPRHCVFTQ